MKELKTYLESLLDDEDELANDNTFIVENFLKENYKINGSYSLDKVDGMIIINAPRSEIVVSNRSNRKLESFTNGLFKFGKCKLFSCSSCKLLKSLEGAPQECEEFSCNSCESLEILKGAPQKCKNFFCINCKNLKSLEGAPQECKKFNCSFCESLTSLEGAPRKCEVFDCGFCGAIVSLKGAPQKCDRFYCGFCDFLISLEGGPKNCKYNTTGCSKLKK